MANFKRIQRSPAEEYNFMSAYPGDNDVFGANRPGSDSYQFDKKTVDAWISFMKSNGIGAVCCLLDSQQLAVYKEAPLLQAYEEAWGKGQVLSAPIPDFTLATPDLLNNKIIPFIQQQVNKGKKVVVHCAGGVGRTGQVLCAWLIHTYKIPTEEAVFLLQRRGRNPVEAVETKKATINDFENLMASIK